MTTQTLTWEKLLLFLWKCFCGGFSPIKKKKKNYSFETLWPDGGRNDLIFHVTFNADTLSAIIIRCLYPICLLKVSLMSTLKHLPDSRGTQITAYFCMQLASKSSSLISCVIHVSSQPMSIFFGVVKKCKIQRKTFWNDQYCYLMGNSYCNSFGSLL